MALAELAVQLSKGCRQADAQILPLIALALCGGDAGTAERAAAEARRLGRRYDECRSLLAVAEIRAGQGEAESAHAAGSEAAQIAREYAMNHLLARAGSF